MIRNFLLKLLLKWYLKENREVVQLTVGEEFNCLKFGNASDVLKIMKSFMTSQTLWYFEAKDDQERNIIKGVVLGMKLLVDSHRTVMKIIEMENEDEKRYLLWQKYKIKRKNLKAN